MTKKEKKEKDKKEKKERKRQRDSSDSSQGDKYVHVCLLTCAHIHSCMHARTHTSTHIYTENKYQVYMDIPNRTITGILM
jgi:hypothetical protein